jgi:hypothetical protein
MALPFTHLCIWTMKLYPCWAPTAMVSSMMGYIECTIYKNKLDVSEMSVVCLCCPAQSWAVWFKI